MRENSRRVTRHFQEVYIWTAFTYKGEKKRAATFAAGDAVKYIEQWINYNLLFLLAKLHSLAIICG